jgi:HEAT repeat protein
LLFPLLIAGEQSARSGNVELYRYGDLLREHNVALTKDSLVRALTNSNGDVRYLAAMKLAEDHDTEAIAAIRSALAVETLPRSRVNISLALGLLGDTVGINELKKLCDDPAFVSEFRLYAVRYLFDLHSQDVKCLEATEAIVSKTTGKFGDRITALSLLPLFENLSSEQSAKVLQLVINSLSDSEPVVRIAASQALVSLGNPKGVTNLEAALEREKDDAVRTEFEEDLKKLQSR